MKQEIEKRNGGFYMNAGKLNPLLDFMNTLFNLFLLNIVFLLTCIPIFTIGTALSSLYYVMFKEVKGEYGYLVRTYLREFKHNFKQGTAAFLLLFLIGFILLFNLLFWPFKGTTISSIITGLLLIIFIIWLSISHYTFPLIGRFVNTTISSIKNAWGLAIRNLKQTFILLLMDAAIVCFLLFFPITSILTVFFIFGFVFIVYFQSYILQKVFAPYEKETQTDFV